MPIYVPAQNAPGPQPNTQKLLGWTFDPVNLSNTLTLTSGVLQIGKIPLYLAQPYSITNVLIEISTGGGTLTSGQNLIGLYNSAGTLVGSSADQSANWTSTGVKTVALASGPFSIQGGANAWCYIAILSNGTTPITIRRGASVAANNAGLVAADGFRFGSFSTGLTALPSPLTISSVAASNAAIWAALT